MRAASLKYLVLKSGMLVHDRLEAHLRFPRFVSCDRALVMFPWLFSTNEAILHFTVPHRHDMR